jgi:hypothetical protein
MKYEYMRLLDPVNNGIIVREDAEKQYQYHNGKWVPTSIMLGYYNPDSLYYDRYEDIDEETANRLIAESEKNNGSDIR